MLAACSAPAEQKAKTDAAQSEAKPDAPPAPPVPPPAISPTTFTDNAKKDAAEREFTYIWPAKVAAIPGLVTQLTADRDKLLAEQKADWQESLREFAGEDCVACTNRTFEKTWEVVADVPRFLSLSGGFYAYTGGAHGNGAMDALVWDREAKAALDPKAMFTSEAALQSALCDPWCKALRAQRSERLGPEYADDSLFECPAIAELTVLLGSSDGKSFNRIGLYAAPYVAGSYAEGDYEITLPVTPKLLGVVKSAYKPAFALGT
ncbi:MAG: PdaC/SigV domain-containing protein [Erythrobacter sp.]